MPDGNQLREDIEYVRAAAERLKPPPVSAIYFLWALLGLCGFAMVDLVGDLRWVGIYWSFAGPIGTALSLWLGMRASRDAGLVNRSEGVRHGLHWVAFMAAGLLGLALVQAGHLTWPGFGSLWVLLLALTYVQAGLHLERLMLPVGLVVGAAYLVTIWVPNFAWTTAGVVVAVGLTAAGFKGAPKRDPAR